MTLLRALVIKIIGMYVCMYVGTYIYITPQVSPPIIFAMEKRWGKKKFPPRKRGIPSVCVRAGDIYALNHTQLCASFYISVYQDDLTASTPYHIHMYVCMYVCMYVRKVSVEVTKLRTNKQHPLSVCMCTCMYACMHVCMYIHIVS